MQSLWTRTAQLKSSCRCPSCLSAPIAAVARRSTTATLGRRIRFGDVVTVFYSSILATAAVADAGWKEVKRKDLDGSIAKAIVDLKATERDQERRIQQVLLKTQDKLRGVEAERSQNTQTTHNILSTTSTTKSHNPPIVDIEQLWRDNDRVRRRRAAHSCRPDVRRGCGTSAGLREKWSNTEQATLKSEKGIQIQGETVGGPSEKDTETALDQHDFRPLSEASNERTTTTRVKMWTSHRVDYPPNHTEASIPSSCTPEVKLGTLDGTQYQRKGVKSHLKILTSSRKGSGWAARNRMEKPSTGVLRARVPKNISPHTDLRLPTLRHRPAGSGPKERLEYKLDTLCLKHIHGGFPLWTLPRGHSQINIWKYTRPTLPLDEPDMSRLEMSVAKLIYRFLIMAMDASKCGSIPLKLPGTATWQLTMRDRDMLKEIIELLNGRLMARKPSVHSLSPSSVFPKYTQEVRGTIGPWKLNQDLLHALPKFTKLEELLPHLCSQLLASPTPPDVHTYNILIVHLSYLQYYDVAAAAVTSMSESDILPNEITTGAMLRFFTHTDDAKRFEEYAEFLNFKSLTAVMVPDNETGMTAGSPAYRFAHKDKGPSNAATYKALILGWLRFGRFEDALVEYRIMEHSGLLRTRPNLHRRLLVSLLQHCVKRNYWEWGNSIWTALTERPTQGQHDMILEQYYWMLQLCVMCRRPSEFRMVVDHGISAGLSNRLGKLRMEDFVSTTEELRRLMRQVALVEKLRDSYALPIHDNTRATAPRLWRVSNLSDWVSQSLEAIDPERRSRAEQAHPVRSISSRPRRYEEPVVGRFGPNPPHNHGLFHSAEPMSSISEESGNLP